MKRIWIMPVILIMSAFLISANARPPVAQPCTQGTNIAKNDSWLIGAYYYQWYGADKPSHWDPSPSQPVLGKYESGDANVICKQIDWAMSSGVDFFAVSWWGDNPADNQKLAAFLNNPAINEMQFAILYESLGPDGRLRAESNNTINLDDNNTATLLSDVRDLAAMYWNHPRYLRINGKPVFIIYVTRGFTGNVAAVMQDVRREANNLGFDPYLVVDQYQWEASMDEGLIRSSGYEAVTAYAMLPSAFPGVDEYIKQYPIVSAQRMKEAHNADSAFVPNVVPAYYSADPDNPHRLVPRMTEIQFKNLLYNALEYADPQANNMVLITSWNEWHEDTSIEPAVEFGTTYLDVLQQTLAEYAPLKAAKADLAQQLGVGAETIQITGIEKTQWGDASLGCPHQPGKVYGQEPTPGYLLTLEADGEEYEYHSDTGQYVIGCETQSAMKKAWNNFVDNLGNWWDEQSEEVQRQIKDWWEEQYKKIEDWINESFNQWWEDFQKQMQAWFEEQLIVFLEQLCNGSAFILPTLAVTIAVSRRRARRVPADGDGAE